MKRLVSAILTISGIVLLIGTGCSPSDSTKDSKGSIVVGKGEVVRKALAVGQITVKHEVPVKSVNGGILSKQIVELGQKVTKGMPLAEVRPVITTINYVEAERSLELANDNVANAEEFMSGSHPAALFTRWLNGPENIARMKRQAELNKKQVEERLDLLRQGKTEAAGRTIDYSVLAPVDGHVIEIVTREGAPVVSSSSFGSGTVLVVLADLDQMLFLGTVDEIDVGRLKTGMNASIRVGALPDEVVSGTVTEIGLKSQTVNNASVFEVRIALESNTESPLRSGYSAVAEIELDRRKNVLVLPERVVRFKQEEALVIVPSSSGETEEKVVKLGLSDGLTVEIVAGLDEGDVVLERN
jgi:HlyD family secretion protein